MIKVTKVEEPKEDKYAEYCVEDALRILTKAEEYKKDSKMMKLVSELASKKKEEFSSIADLRGKYNEMVSEDEDEEEEDDAS